MIISGDLGFPGRCSFRLVKPFLRETQNEKRATHVRVYESAAKVLEPLDYKLRASSYDPGNRAGSVTGMNFVVCSYGKFQPGYRDETQETKPKWRNINKYCSRLS